MSMTTQERDTLIALGHAWKKFGEIADRSGAEENEFARIMMTANNLILARGAARDMRAQSEKP